VAGCKPMADAMKKETTSRRRLFEKVQVARIEI
jgi:hypothetical protein